MRPSHQHTGFISHELVLQMHKDRKYGRVLPPCCHVGQTLPSQDRGACQGAVPGLYHNTSCHVGDATEACFAGYPLLQLNLVQVAATGAAHGAATIMLPKPSLSSALSIMMVQGERESLQAARPKHAGAIVFICLTLALQILPPAGRSQNRSQALSCIRIQQPISICTSPLTCPSQPSHQVC